MGLTKNHLDLRHKESFIERTTKRQSLKDLSKRLTLQTLKRGKFCNKYKYLHAHC